MPKMVKIGPQPGYKVPALKKDPTADEKLAWETLKAAWEAVQKRGVVEVDYGVAMEALQNGRGMYRILPEVAPVETSAPGVRMPEDMTADELKLTALQLGVDLTKPMKKADLVKTVRLAMDKVQLLEDDSEEEDGAA